MTRKVSGPVVVVLVSAFIPEAIAQSSAGFKARLDAIVKTQSEAKQRFHRDVEGKATAEGRKPATDRFLAETAANTEEVLGLVVANPNDPAAGEALRFVVRTARTGPGDESYRAMEILLRDHVRDPGMGEFCEGVYYFVHAPVVESLLRAVLERHPNRDDRGQACYALAMYLAYQAHTVRVIRKKPTRIDDWVHERHKETFERFVKETDPEALEKQSAVLFERIVAEFGDVKDTYDQRSLAALAEGGLFRLRSLAVGKVAPEIAGKDHEGNSFALSDYRGKVVVLTFSGNWCGSCVAMYAQERTLITRLAGKPFALLSVNTDPDVETLKASITSSEITWRCWCDGGTTGPITTRWGIWYFPTIFVLDRAGVIRFKDLTGDDLDRAVESLVEEASLGTSSER